MAVEKIKNKLYGYKCDKTRITPTVIYRDEDGFMCYEVAVKKYGNDLIDKLDFEEH